MAAGINRTLTSPSTHHVEHREQLFAGPYLPITWSSILAGSVVSLALWGLLYVLGLALGVSNVNPHDSNNLRASGIFTGIWGSVTPLLALFIGGLLAARGSRAVSKVGGAFHGLATWGVTTLVGTWLAVMFASAVLGGAFSMGKAAVAGATPGSEVVKRVAEDFGLDDQAVLGTVNQRLREQGKQELTYPQLRAATRDAVRDSVRDGRLDRQTLVQSLASHTPLSQQDAQQVATSIEQQFSAMTQRLGQAAKTGAAEAADAAEEVLWVMFAAMLLSMAAAIAGGVVAIGKRVHHDGDEDTAMQSPTAGRQPPAPPRGEVYS